MTTPICLRRRIRRMALTFAIAIQSAVSLAQITDLEAKTKSGTTASGTLAEIQLTTRKFGPSAGLSRGINFGNMLDSPQEGSWGFEVEESFFRKAAEAGFKTVRLPVSWTTHTSHTPPYPIDEPFFQRVDWCVAQARQQQLKIIVNVHHYEELNADPTQEWERALAIWQQIANRYQNEPETVFFEVLNEPHDQFNDHPELWNRFMTDALQIIRRSNPVRKVIIGPVSWNSIDSLKTLEPPSDPNLIVSVHYYHPFSFTHQGAPWIDPPLPLDTPWTGETIDLAPDWQNYGWNLELNPTDQGLQTTFTAGWAGLRFHSPVPIENVERFTFQLDRSLKLRLSWQNGKQPEQEAMLQTENGIKSYTVDLKTGGRPITDLTIQNFTENETEAFLLKSCVLKGPATEISLLSSQSEAMKNQFRKAAQWSADHDLPMHLGEFGVYRSAPADSRAIWAAAVRSTCDEFNIDWAWWDFVAEFRVYNAGTDTWESKLLRALIPSE